MIIFVVQIILIVGIPMAQLVAALLGNLGSHESVFKDPGVRAANIFYMTQPSNITSFREYPFGHQLTTVAYLSAQIWNHVLNRVCSLLVLISFLAAHDAVQETKQVLKSGQQKDFLVNYRVSFDQIH